LRHIPELKVEFLACFVSMAAPKQRHASQGMLWIAQDKPSEDLPGPMRSERWSLRRLLEVLVAFDVMGETHRIEARFLTAAIARRKALAIKHGDLVLRRVIGTMNDTINARMLDRIAWPVFSRRHRFVPCRSGMRERASIPRDTRPSRAAYLIACGLMGEPVAPVITSGGAQKKNS
jgi:hypothetical protein